MRKSRLLFIIISISLCVSACSFDNNINNPNILNPFEDIDDEGTMIMSEYGHSPYNFPENFMFYYQGGILEIPYIFFGGRVDSEVGLLIFIDGVVQPYFISGLEELPDYMHIFNIEANSEKVYMLNIIPTAGVAGDYLQLNFVCIDFPSLDGSDAAMLDLQNMSATISWTLAFLENSPYNHGLPSYKKAEIVDVFIEGNYDGSDFYFEIDNESENPNSIRIIAYKERSGIYRTTIFINNSPVIIDGSNNFFEYNASRNQRLIYEFEINIENLNNINIIYAISISLSNDTGENTIDVFKANSEIIKLMN